MFLILCNIAQIRKKKFIKPMVMMVVFCIFGYAT
jgi:hypothetical protein